MIIDNFIYWNLLIVTLLLPRLKPYLLAVRERDGIQAYIEATRNCVAGCQKKWKSMPKVCEIIKLLNY